MSEKKGKDAKKAEKRRIKKAAKRNAKMKAAIDVPVPAEELPDAEVPQLQIYATSHNILRVPSGMSFPLQLRW